MKPARTSGGKSSQAQATAAILHGGDRRYAWLLLVALCAFLTLSLACSSSEADDEGRTTGADQAAETAPVQGQAEATPTPEATATPAPSPTPTPEPRPEGSILDEYRIIAYYGHPFSPIMGILGEHEKPMVLERLQQQIGAFQAADPAGRYMPAFHMVYAVAQADPGADGSYLYHTDAAVVQDFIDFTRENDMLLFLDLQNGRNDVAAEVENVLPFLAEPHVHLAIDPEFTWTEEQFPNVNIGSVDAVEINQAQQILSDFVLENNLPNKILMVHQFLDTMVTNKQDVIEFEGVDLTYDMDGFGYAETKIEKYYIYAVNQPAAPYRTIKLFYQYDVDLMTPETLLALDPPPHIIMYQ